MSGLDGGGHDGLGASVGSFVSMAVLELFDLCHRNTCHVWQRCLLFDISSNVSFVHFMKNCTICTFCNIYYVLYNMYTFGPIVIVYSRCRVPLR